MKKLSQNFIIRAEILYELAEKISYLLEDYLYQPEDKLINDKLVSIFRTELNKAVEKLASEEQIEQWQISEALINYLDCLSLNNQDNIVCNFINSFRQN